ncbi:S53 family peptidase [Hamadaea sp. NPDC051192]|uniref:S53 family peptidase n=1 Tax=Hamadaea sp. NPDC051192 TaxID=3154940 RepID=UPI00343166F3
MRILRTALATLFTATIACALSPSAQAAPSPVALDHRSAKVCAAAAPGTATCHAWVRTDVTAAAVPAGFGPSDLRAAYNLTGSGSASQTIAIVDAYDDPTAEADLATYRSTYGLAACTTANGCFKKVDQNGGTSYPHRNTGWAQEISLDLDMASAICPNCKILLVEAKSNSFANLGTAVNYAATHATVVSNSWGGGDAADSTYGSYFNHPGVPITASSGDNGYGASYPATSQYVTAVGGTHLVMSGGARSSETVWSGAGSGCSAYNTALSAQSTFDTGCAKRAEADVAAVADPNTGVSVMYNGAWYIFGGTSVSAPIIASVYALAGNGAGTTPNYPYQHAGSANFYDVTSGSNGSCPTAQWCTARAGWDGPTGVGTPNGTGGF